MKRYNEFINETQKMKKVLYTAVVLTKESESILRAKFPAKFENTFYHHSTIKFKPSEAEVEKLPLGETYTLEVIGIAKDDKAEAVLVENKYSQNPFPHITLSCNKGVKPQYSNELLKGDIEYLKDIEEFKDNPLFLEGIVTAL